MVADGMQPFPGVGINRTEPPWRGGLEEAEGAGMGV